MVISEVSKKYNISQDTFRYEDGLLIEVMIGYVKLFIEGDTKISKSITVIG